MSLWNLLFECVAYPVVLCYIPGRNAWYRIMKLSTAFGLLVSISLLTGCSYISQKLNPAPPKPKEQKILRVWRGKLYDTTSKSICGIYTSPDEIDNLRGQGWMVKSSQPIYHRIDQRYSSAECIGSEVVMEK